MYKGHTSSVKLTHQNHDNRDNQLLIMAIMIIKIIMAIMNLLTTRVGSDVTFTCQVENISNYKVINDDCNGNHDYNY